MDIEQRAKELYEVAEEHGITKPLPWEKVKHCFTGDMYRAAAKYVNVEILKARIEEQLKGYQPLRLGDLQQQLTALEGLNKGAS